MRMIIGGAAQGKLEYAKSLLPAGEWTEEDIWMGEQADTICKRAKILYKLNDYVSILLKDDQEPLPHLLELVAENPDILLVCDEIGCGVVPVDPFERRLRETVGRVCCVLVRQAEQVDRVFCSIPTVISRAGQGKEELSKCAKD